MTLSPMDQQERIITLDIIRGFALLGIFWVNMPTFQWPQLMVDLYMHPYELSGADRWIRLFFDVFVQAKFFTIFSFLFGLGFYFFMSRAEQKGFSVYRLFSRRLFVLALFGLVHLVLFWYGDVLLTYALAGFVLMLFYQRQTKTILMWLAAALFVLAFFILANFMVPASNLEAQVIELQSQSEGKVQEAIDVYRNGSLGEWLRYRFTDEVIPIIQNIPFDVLIALFMFLIGLYAGKRGIFQNFSQHKPFVARIWWICLIISLPLSAMIVLIHLRILDFGLLTEIVNQSIVNISGIPMSLFYIASLLFLLQKDLWLKWFMPLSYAGRMALTNYLTQTVIGVGLYTGFGFFGKLNLAYGLVICIVVFTLQIVFSYFWLKAFRFGPLEWIWRSLTYGKFQPMRRNTIYNSRSA